MGDLYVVVNVEEPSDKFERDGSTIYYKLNLNFVQAALGDSVEVPTVHGDDSIQRALRLANAPLTWQGSSESSWWKHGINVTVNV